jgi:hemerythrin-like domain-containing protein
MICCGSTADAIIEELPVSASDRATDAIQIEHRSLASVLQTMQTMLDKIAAGYAPADFALLAAALYYIDDFPERHHHPKEDAYLFKRLRARTNEFDDILDRLQSEHERSALSVAGLHRALVHFQGGALEGLPHMQAAIDSYATEMRKHIAMENDLLTRARPVLSEQDWEAIAGAFAANDDPLFGDNRRLEFSQLYQRIRMLTPRKLRVKPQAARVSPAGM